MPYARLHLHMPPTFLASLLSDTLIIFADKVGLRYRSEDECTHGGRRPD